MGKRVRAQKLMHAGTLMVVHFLPRTIVNSITYAKNNAAGSRTDGG